MNEIFQFFDQMLNSAGKAGNLPVNAVWALFCMSLGLAWAYDKREARRKFDKDQVVREQKIVNETKMADTLFKLADAYERLADTSKASIDIILNLRRP